METVTEKKAGKMNGFIALLLNVGLLGLSAFFIYLIALDEDPVHLWGLIPALIFWGIMMGGFMVVQPNEARVLVLFGKYIGSVRESGFWWVNPFTIKRHVSLRIHNFNSEMIKVNDLHGNPIEIAAVIVWRVIDSSRALFDVENYEQFVAIQSETAIRGLASEYPYDAQDEDRPSLRSNPHEIIENLKEQLQKRLDVAGIEVIESRLSHLAYAQEIAQAMLRRQQAQAIIAARQKIVEGAVGMVEQALRMLSEHKIVTLDEEKKATMVNNLLVALVSESQAQPIINTGTLY
ncbi:MAG: SPFH domain-containing protein [Bacteroidetes bacterium]|jgi:regulator of protease activity HflC (stomatin/prohibitin superfamily)|nr:SPFH domain-containing protein [Bacteroidota bacterium]